MKVHSSNDESFEEVIRKSLVSENVMEITKELCLQYSNQNKEYGEKLIVEL